MLKTLTRLLVSIVFLGLPMVAAAQAGTTPQLTTATPSAPAGPAQEANVFRLNVSPYGYPPYLIVRGDRYDGIVWDVVMIITQKMAYRIEALKVPRMRVDQMVIAGYLDGALRAKSWTVDPDQFLWSDVIITAEEVFFYRAEDNFHYETPEDLHGKTILTRLGYQYPVLDEIFETGKAVRFDVSQDEIQLRYLLHSGRFNAALMDHLTGHWLSSNDAEYQGKFRVSKTAISSVGLRLMVHAGMQDFITAFNAELQQLKTSGQLAEIVSRYQ